jgi:hypothetical protein
MRASTVPAALLVLALAGCSANAPTAPTAIAASASTAGTYTTPGSETGIAAHPSAQPRPIKGECEASYAEPPVVTLPLIRHISVGTCQLSHLGRVSLRTVAEINVATGIQVAEATLTAANGDQLLATSVGTGTPIGPIVHFAGTATVIGGTGRFASAIGEMAVVGTSDSTTGDARFSYDGWITYDASERRRP